MYVSYLVCLMVAAQTAPANTFTVSSGTLQIPFRADPKRTDVRSLLLYVSRDQGQSWQAAAKQPANSRSFKFQAPADGVYWFIVATEDAGGRQQPADIYQAQPSLKVMVDTRAKGAMEDADTPPLRARLEQLEKRIIELEGRKKRQKDAELLKEKLDSLEKRVLELEKQEKTKP